MENNNLIGTSESTTIEWKPSLSQINDIIETVVAFANTEGGKVFIGVSKTGKIIGIQIGKGTIENLTNQISQHTDPKIHPRITTGKIKDEEIIIVDVKESSDHLFLAFGKPYKRVGKSTVKMSKDEYERLILEKHKEKLRFDSDVCVDARPVDVDKIVVRDFIKKAHRERSLGISENISLMEALRRMKLVQDDKLTNAAVLLFGKNPQKWYLQSVVKAIRFKGVTVTGEMLDFKMFEGDIISQLKRVEDFIFEHIPIRAWIENGKLERQEKWLYPPKAIREALANALAHRDYRMTSHVQVRIFDDRMEIWNPGGLPAGITVQKLKKHHDSIPRNPLIARAFFWIKYAEEVGTGTNKLVDWCREWGLPDPDFEDTGSAMVTRFRHPFITESKVQDIHLNERQKKALKYIKEKNSISRKEYVLLNKVSTRQANRDINKLLKNKIISMVSKGRGTRYTVK